MTLGHRTDVSKPLHLLADGIAKRGMVILVSDLLDDPARVVDGLRHFRFRGTEVIVFHVMDPDELTFPFQRAARFRDLEGGEELMAVPSVVREEYLGALTTHSRCTSGNWAPPESTTAFSIRLSLSSSR